MNGSRADLPALPRSRAVSPTACAVRLRSFLVTFELPPIHLGLHGCVEALGCVPGWPGRACAEPTVVAILEPILQSDAVRVIQVLDGELVGRAELSRE